MKDYQRDLTTNIFGSDMSMEIVLMADGQTGFKLQTATFYL